MAAVTICKITRRGRGSQRLSRLLALAFLLVVLPSPAFGKTISVSHDGVVSSVQSAIVAAQAGDTIEVQPGTYTGNLVLDKTLTIVGIGWPVVRGDGRGSVITVRGNSYTIQGLIV